MDGFKQEVLLKEKAQYSRPPYTDYLGSAQIYSENIIYPVYKTSYCNEVTRTEPSP
jgi:hypothetical protein